MIESDWGGPRSVIFKGEPCLCPLVKYKAALFFFNLSIPVLYI